MSRSTRERAVVETAAGGHWKSACKVTQDWLLVLGKWSSLLTVQQFITPSYQIQI